VAKAIFPSTTLLGLSPGPTQDQHKRRRGSDVSPPRRFHVSEATFFWPARLLTLRHGVPGDKARCEKHL
jgi:hypothetical protein